MPKPTAKVELEEACDTAFANLDAIRDLAYGARSNKVLIPPIRDKCATYVIGIHNAAESLLSVAYSSTGDTFTAEQAADIIETASKAKEAAFELSCLLANVYANRSTMILRVVNAEHAFAKLIIRGYHREGC